MVVSACTTNEIVQSALLLVSFPGVIYFYEERSHTKIVGIQSVIQHICTFFAGLINLDARLAKATLVGHEVGTRAEVTQSL